MPIFKIAMGTKVKDKTTGFVGQVTASLLYMTGCIQYQVEAAKGLEIKAYWIDEQRLEIIPKKVKRTTERKYLERHYD